MFTERTILVALAGAILSPMPALADFKLERQLTLQPGGRFILTADVGDVVVAGDSSQGATVVVTSGRDDIAQRYDFRFEERAGVVQVTVKRRGTWLSGLFGGDWFTGGTRFDVRVPRETAVSVQASGGSVQVARLVGETLLRSSGGGLRLEEIEGRVDVHTSGGSIHARSVRGDVRAKTSGGGIDVADVRGSLRAETSGGGIQIDTVSGEIYAETSGGGVRVQGAGGRVEAHSSGGTVTVAFAAGNGNGGALSSSGGGVRAVLDPTVSLSMDATSSGGSVNCDLPVTVRGTISGGSLRGDLNGGGQTLRLRSSGGGVRISGTANLATSR